MEPSPAQPAPAPAPLAANRPALDIHYAEVDLPARQGPTYHITRQVFLRGLGLVYLCAFLSLWVQIHGLIGEHGVLPAHDYFSAIQRAADHGAAMRDHPIHPRLDFPSLLWLGQSDHVLDILCGGGVVLSVMVMAGLAQAPGFALLWAFYLSLVVAGQDFLSFQWDILLLEAGFLAIFFAPLQMRPRLARQPEPSRIVRWLIWWLLFRLMFCSGLVKLTFHDPAWLNGTAMNFHYLSQPLPTWTSWYAYRLPNGMQRASLWGMFAIEVGVPFLIFLGRRARLVAFAPLVLLQLLITATGNYGFFNLLTIVLCLSLLDDTAWRRIGNMLASSATRWRRRRAGAAPPAPAEPKPAPRLGRLRWPVWVTAPLAVVIVILTTMTSIDGSFPRPIVQRWPAPLLTMQRWAAPFESTNAYGLFRVMTRGRPEIIIEGSRDGVTWREYAFKWKPGDVQRRPAYCVPHMPRLDWQAWKPFLGDELGDARWLVLLLQRILEDRPEVLGLLESNPFQNDPPTYLRVLLYDYGFTNADARSQTGAWWVRTYVRPFGPAVMLDGSGRIVPADVPAGPEKGGR